MIENLKENLESKAEEDTVGSSFKKIAESMCKAN